MSACLKPVSGAGADFFIDKIVEGIKDREGLLPIEGRDYQRGVTNVSEGEVFMARPQDRNQLLHLF